MEKGTKERIIKKKKKRKNYYEKQRNKRNKISFAILYLVHMPQDELMAITLIGLITEITGRENWMTMTVERK